MATVRIAKLNKSYGDACHSQGYRTCRSAKANSSCSSGLPAAASSMDAAAGMIAGLDGVTSGDIFIGERRVNDLEPAHRKIAMVFQSYALYPPYEPVKKNTPAFGLKFTGMACRTRNGPARGGGRANAAPGAAAGSAAARPVGAAREQRASRLMPRHRARARWFDASVRRAFIQPRCGAARLDDARRDRQAASPARGDDDLRHP